MGVFSRMRDIIASNINAMLDSAEDPEKLVKLMIQEMEDTLVEVKASCAGAMANRRKIERELESARMKSERWERKAALAVEKDREDLAREALLEKKRCDELAASLQRELDSAEGIVSRYREDIAVLEEKIASAREKHRTLVQRHAYAKKKKQTESTLRKAETSDAFLRFEQFQQRIDRMEADGELINGSRKKSLDEEFEALEKDDEVERELKALKARIQGERASTPSTPGGGAPLGGAPEGDGPKQTYRSY